MKASKRLLSLDAFRGFTIAWMIVVNTPGNSTSYAWLKHADWHGCTFADLVFPFFIFILGVSVVFSFSSSSAQLLTRRQEVFKIIKRTIIIFGLGLFLNAFPAHFYVESFRILGVLQRIALCYFFSALLCLYTRISLQAFILFSLLLVYWLISMWMPIPDYGAGLLTPEGYIGAYLDRLIFSSAHLYKNGFEPEGLLSTCPAVATALIGNLVGYGLRTTQADGIKALGLLMAGMVFLVMGWIWNDYFPINKALWTSSYVLWSAGWACLVLGIFYYLIEVKHWAWWARPFEVFGVNALLVYVLHVMVFKIQLLVKVSNAQGESKSLRAWLTSQCFGWTSAQNASLLYAMSGMLFWWGVMYVFYRKRIFLKV